MKVFASRKTIQSSLFIALLAAASPAYSKQPACSFSVTGLAFGTVDLTAGGTFDSTATLSATCSGGNSLAVVRICPNINAGSGGVANGGDPRYMLSGTTQLKYNLFQDPARSTIWGSYLWPYPSFSPPTIDLILDSTGNGSTTATIYGRIYAGQQALPPGTYSSSFSGAQIQIAWKQNPNQSCSQIGSFNATTAPFTVSATYPPTCTLASSTLNFGAVGTLNSAINGSSTLTATCSASTPYTIGLGGGNTGASDPTQRKMSSGGANVTYGLYRDSARSRPWGNTVGVNTAAASGSGFGQSLTVYGQVPVQATPVPGTYSDMIIATITY